MGVCVDEGFRHLDAVSPRIGGFLFEDVVAPFVRADGQGAASPAKQQGSSVSGSGASRARRRAWAGAPGQPELLLNSTWLESANAAALSTLRPSMHDVPAGEDVVWRLGAEPSLVAAAYAARFSFVNPIAGLQPACGRLGRWHRRWSSRRRRPSRQQRGQRLARAARPASSFGNRISS